MWLFAKYPDQWDMVREDPRLIPSAINEVLRYDAPIRGFSRYVARDVDMDGVLLPAGSRAIEHDGARAGTSVSIPTPIGSMCCGAPEITWVSVPARTPASA